MVQSEISANTKVAIGDQIELGGVGAGRNWALVHKGIQVGYLANKIGAGGPNASLKVSAVIRFPLTCPDKIDDSTTAACVRERGWGYVVLVSGRLR